MGQYIKSEFYRILHYKWTYLFIAICSALLISSNVILAAVKLSDRSFPWATTYFSFSNFYSSMSTIFILCICVSAIIFGNEYTNHTLKNGVSYGISRASIFVGKLIVQICYALVAFIIITVAHIVSGYLLLENSGPGNLEILLRTAFVCLPLFLFAMAASNCFQFINDNPWGSAGEIILIILVIPIISSFLGMRFQFFHDLSKVLPYTMIQGIDYDFKKLEMILPWKGITGYINYWLIGVIEMVLISILGYTIFRKKDIN